MFSFPLRWIPIPPIFSWFIGLDVMLRELRPDLVPSYEHYGYVILFFGLLSWIPQIYLIIYRFFYIHGNGPGSWGTGWRRWVTLRPSAPHRTENGAAAP